MQGIFCLGAVMMFIITPPVCIPLALSHWDLEGANDAELSMRCYVLSRTCDGKAICDPHSPRSRAPDDLDWRERNCLCDTLCAQYGDCCLDSPFFVAAEQRRGVASFTCVELKQFGGVYMHTACPPEWSDAEIRIKCEADPRKDESLLSDPLSAMPVTSHSTGVSYRNLHCALCHKDLDLNKTDLWSPRLECPTLHLQYNRSLEEVANSLVYSRERKSWGLNLTDTGFHLCHVDPVMPETSGHIVRRCQADISKTCAVNWTNAEVRNRCEAYTSVVYNGAIGYRNPHCAMCNNIPVQYLSCSKSLQRSNFNKDWSPIAFAVLFDLSGSQTGDAVGKILACPDSSQLYDPFFRRCRSVVCTEGQEYSNGKCISIVANIATTENTFYIIENTTDTNDEIIFEDINSTEDSQELNDSSETGSYFLNCPKFLLDPNDYTINDDNESIYVSKYDKTFEEREFRLIEGAGVEICAPSLDVQLVDKFGPYMGYVTIAGLGVSVVFLCLHLIAFILIPDMRNLSGKNLASLCVSLLFAYCSFIIGQFLNTTTIPCVVSAAVTYYFFLASFCWMLAMAFDVWRTLRLATSELRVSAGKQWRKFTVYSALCWVSPGLLVMAAMLVDTSLPGAVHEQLRPEFGEFSCWFGHRNSLLLFFAAPLALIMGLNIIFFSSSAHMIFSTTSTTRYTSSSGTQRDFKLYARLALVMGLTWTVGLVAGYLDLEGLWYAFVALNTLQGLFIFLAFTCTDKVVRGIMDRYKGSCRHRDSLGSSVMKNHRPPSFSWSGTSTASTHKSRLGSISESSHHPDSHRMPDTLY
nr:unnamed protein product [Timema californicum]